MGDLHSIPSSLSYSMDMNNAAPFHDLHSDDLSSGYLEDALLEFSSSKRRRLLLFNDDHHNQTSFPGYWNSISPQDLDNSYESFCKLYADNNAAVMNGEDRRKRVEETHSTSSSESNKSSIHTHCFSPKKQMLLSSHHSLGGRNEERKKKVVTRVVYPFALVKPGGIKGDITLNDINRRILMPPTRPLKHPVGDFACRPLVSPDGFGLSGKAVVALTRIHTQGRGTITIIKTKN